MIAKITFLYHNSYLFLEHEINTNILHVVLAKYKLINIFDIAFPNSLVKLKLRD
jgi:hypothetical protein